VRRRRNGDNGGNGGNDRNVQEWWQHRRQSIILLQFGGYGEDVQAGLGKGTWTASRAQPFLQLF
jgi:hypothetical protein